MHLYIAFEFPLPIKGKGRPKETVVSYKKGIGKNSTRRAPSGFELVGETASLAAPPSTAPAALAPASPAPLRPPIQPGLLDPALFEPFTTTETGLRYVDLTGDSCVPGMQSPRVYQRVTFEVIDEIEATGEAIYDFDLEVEGLMDCIVEIVEV